MKAEHRTQLVVTSAFVILFCVGGVIMITLGTQKYVASKLFVAEAKSASGRVTGFKIWDAPGTDSWDDIHYAMVLFTLEDGREIHFQGPSKDGLVKLHKGDEVRVLYDPTDPTIAKVDSFMGLWFAATMLCGMGAAAIVIPLFTLWQAWKWVKRQ